MAQTDIFLRKISYSSQASFRLAWPCCFLY